MTKPNVVIFDCATGQEIVREMNKAEYEQWLKDQEPKTPVEE